MYVCVCVHVRTVCITLRFVLGCHVIFRARAWTWPPLRSATQKTQIPRHTLFSQFPLLPLRWGVLLFSGLVCGSGPHFVQPSPGPKFTDTHCSFSSPRVGVTLYFQGSCVDLAPTSFSQCCCLCRCSAPCFERLHGKIDVADSRANCDKICQTCRLV